MASSDSQPTMHDLPLSERPRERLLENGPQALSTAELLAILLRSGSQQENVLQLANRILAQFDGLHGLGQATAAELMQLRGLGAAKATQLLAALELGQRVSQLQPKERLPIRSAADAAQLISDMGNLVQEQIRVILLDNARRVMTIQTVYVGTVNTSIMRNAEIFREAIVRNSPAIIVAHNHPSGNPMPSPEDVNVTRTLIAAGDLLDIQVLDHIIVAAQAWRSMREMGLAFKNQET